MALEACDVVVVGGGVIGRSVAAEVAAGGAKVVVVEPGGVTQGTSVGNAGHLVPSHIVPFSAPGMVKAGINSLIARNGAFAISPRVVPGIAGWLWRFARSANEANVQRGLPVLRSMLDATVAGVHELRAAGAEVDFIPTGLLQIASSPKSWAGVRHEMEEWTHHGVNARELNGKEVLEHEPLLRPGILGGVLLLDDACFDPLLLVKAITARGAGLGVTDVNASVQRIERVQGGVVVHTSAGPVKAAQVVVAAGVWSPKLLKPFGIKVPVRPARGDSVTLPYGPGVPKPGVGMMMVDQKVALSPLSKGLRITGRFGLTSASDRALNMKRAQTLIRKVGSVLELDPATAPNEVWTGLRPATPDGLPLLGRLPGAPEVIASVGHGMLGSTTSIGSAKAVAAVVRGEAAPFDMAPVSPARFSRR